MAATPTAQASGAKRCIIERGATPRARVGALETLARGSRAGCAGAFVSILACAMTLAFKPTGAGAASTVASPVKTASSSLNSRANSGSVLMAASTASRSSRVAMPRITAGKASCNSKWVMRVPPKHRAVCPARTSNDFSLCLSERSSAPQFLLSRAPQNKPILRFDGVPHLTRASRCEPEH